MSVCVLGGIIVCIVLIYTLLNSKTNSSQKIIALAQKHIALIGFLIALSAVVSSLIYSELIGYAPCLLCWWARVFFYPQLVIFGIALYKKEKTFYPYALALTVLGLCVSTYHYIVESVGYSPLPCEATGVSCLVRYVHTLGFITIPLMGLVGFATLLLFLIVSKKPYSVSY